MNHPRLSTLISQILSRIPLPPTLVLIYILSTAIALPNFFWFAEKITDQPSCVAPFPSLPLFSAPLFLFSALLAPSLYLCKSLPINSEWDKVLLPKPYLIFANISLPLTFFLIRLSPHSFFHSLPAVALFIFLMIGLLLLALFASSYTKSLIFLLGSQEMSLLVLLQMGLPIPAFALIIYITVLQTPLTYLSITIANMLISHKSSRNPTTLIILGGALFFILLCSAASSIILSFFVKDSIFLLSSEPLKYTLWAIFWLYSALNFTVVTSMTIKFLSPLFRRFFKP